MKRSSLWCGIAFALSGTAPAVAQQNQGQDQQNQGQDQPAQAQEQIIVTATRREQNLQEVPVSIVAITGDNMEKRGIENVERLNATVPNLSVMGSAGGSATTGTSFRIRGIPGVGTYVDGIWQVSTQGLLTQEFIDIDRIEVLRGPQGTLFGRDSVGGSVRIITKRPAQEFGASVKTTVGTLNRRDATVSVDVPFSDTVLSKWTFGSLNRDGYIDNRTTGGTNGGVDQMLLRGDITFTPSDRLDFRFNLQSNDNEFTEPRVQDAVFEGTWLFPVTLTGLYTAAGLDYTRETQMAGWPGGEVGKWETNSQITIPNRIQTDQFSMDANWDVGDNVSLEFLTGYVDQEVRNFVDFDNSQYGLVEDLNYNELSMWSQEIQISGGRGRIDWVGGIYYWDQDTRARGIRYAAEEFRDDGSLDDTANPPPGSLLDIAYQSQFCQDLLINPPPGPSSTCEAAANFYGNFTWIYRNGGLGGNLSRQHQDGWAVFGEATVALTDKLDFTFGLRHHDQSIESEPMIPTSQAPLHTNMDYTTDPFQGYGTGNVTPANFDKSTGRLSLQYQFTGDIMGYVSYSQGFNSGSATYVTHPVTGEQILFSTIPETLNNYELGVRSDLAGGMIRLNATAFFMDWEDLQAVTTLRIDGFDVPGVVNQNIGNAEASGLEIEFSVAPTDNLLFNVNVGTLDTKFTEIFLPPEFGWVAGETEFSQAPELTYNIGFQHTADLENGGTFTTRLDYSWSDQYWRQFDPTLRTISAGVPDGWNDETGDFGYLNARLTYESQNRNYEISVFGTNLTNEYVLNSGFFHGLWGFDFASVAPPRLAGVSMKVFFD
jgi:iron complex outermembrane receptor protein